MIDVARDTEGLQIAFTEIFEQDFDRARIQRSAESASAETRARLLATVAPLTLSPGYHRFAHCLIQLEDEVRQGIGLPPATTPSFVADGLRCLALARSLFEGKHPPCSACGARQDNRYSAQCVACGVKFRRKH